MKNNKFIIVVTGIVLFALSCGIVFVFINRGHNYKQKLVEKYLLEDVNLEKITVIQDDIKKYFEDKYFENEKIATFSSFQNRSTDISLGELTGALRLLSSLEINDTNKNEVKNIFYDYLNSNPSLHELDLLYFESFLYKGGIQTKTSPEEAIKILEKYYNESSKLFCRESAEPVNLMLGNTGIALEIYENYGLQIKTIEDIKTKVLEMYNSEQYFNPSNNDYITKQIQSRILSLLYQLNIDIDQNGIKSYHNEWLSAQNKSLSGFN